jgi:subtilase family serine protease
LCTYADDDGIAGMATESHQASCTVPALDGDYYFGVVVDPSDAISETDETNNAASDPLLVTVTPLDVDLIPSAVTSSSYAVDTAEVIDLATTITNAGTTPSPAFDVSFYISANASIDASDELVCTTAVPAGLAAGGNTDALASCAVPLLSTGAYYLGAIADPADQIGESSEVNNAAAAASLVDITAPNVDLAYALHWHDAVSLSPGQLVTYHLQVQNNGTAASPGFDASIHYSSDMNVTSGDPSACTVALGSVPALTITEFTFDCNVPIVPPDWYFSGAIIDPANDVPETDETNNTGVAPFTEQIL